MIRILFILGLLTFSGVVIYIQIDLFSYVEALISAFNQAPHCLEKNTSTEDEFGGEKLDENIIVEWGFYVRIFFLLSKNKF